MQRWIEGQYLKKNAASGFRLRSCVFFFLFRPLPVPQFDMFRRFRRLYRVHRTIDSNNSRMKSVAASGPMEPVAFGLPKRNRTRWDNMQTVEKWCGKFMNNVKLCRFIVQHSHSPGQPPRGPFISDRIHRNITASRVGKGGGAGKLDAQRWINMNVPRAHYCDCVCVSVSFSSPSHSVSVAKIVNQDEQIFYEKLKFVSERKLHNNGGSTGWQGSNRKQKRLCAHGTERSVQVWFHFWFMMRINHSKTFSHRNMCMEQTKKTPKWCLVSVT